MTVKMEYRHKPVNGQWGDWQPLYNYNIFHQFVGPMFAKAYIHGSTKIEKFRFSWGKHGLYDFREAKP